MGVVLSPDELKRGAGALRGCLPLTLRDKIVMHIIDWVSSELLRVYNARTNDADDVPDRVPVDFSQDDLSDAYLEAAAKKIALQSDWALTRYDHNLKTIYLIRKSSVAKTVSSAA